MPKTLAQLRQAVRELTSTEGAGSVSDTEITDRINERGSQLYDLMIGANDSVFIAAPSLFSLVGGYGANSVTLPNDHYQTRGVEKDPTLPSRCTICQLASFAERDRPSGLRFDVDGLTLTIYPPELAKGNYALLYVATYEVAAKPANDAATFPQQMAPYELYVELGAAVDVIDKREMDSSGVAQRLAAETARVSSALRRRSHEPKQVPRVVRSSWWDR